MITFALDENHDIFLDKEGNIATKTGQEQIAQDVATACLLVEGEDRFDTTRGIPYNLVIGNPVNLSLLQEYVEREAMRCDDSVLSATITSDSFNNRTKRQLGFDIKVSTKEGEVDVV